MRLPLGLYVERFYAAQPQDTALTEDRARALFRDYFDRWAAGALVAGRILSEEDDLEQNGSVWTLTKTLHCREMIARSAEIPILELEQHGTNDQRGTNGAAD